MLRLDLKREPYWLELANGVRVLVRPPTMAMILQARRETMRAVAAELVAADNGPGRAMAFTQALGRQAVVEWEGVGDEADRPAPVTAAGVDALLELPVMGLAFDARYTAPALRVEAEKNALAPSPNGTSAEGPATAVPAKDAAPTAPMT